MKSRFTLRLWGGVFTPRLWPTLITAILLATLIGLGTWQLQRLGWKESLIATIALRQHELPNDIMSLLQQYGNDDLAYRPATAEGNFLVEKELYLNAISLDGKGGYHVLSPLQLRSGDWLLVDRGWIPYDHRPNDSEAPTAYTRPAGKVTIRGLLRLPNKAGWFAPTNRQDTNNWYSFDLAAMAAALGVPTLLPVILAADDTPNPGGYPVGGQTRLDLPNDHLGYAITWYSLALALLVIYGVAGWKREGQP